MYLMFSRVTLISVGEGIPEIRTFWERKVLFWDEFQNCQFGCTALSEIYVSMIRYGLLNTEHRFSITLCVVFTWTVKLRVLHA